MKRMKEFIERYRPTGAVLDVGSRDVNGSYRELFDDYTGADLVPGKNVDIVLEDPYRWQIRDTFYDVVISGQCLEHVEDTVAWIKEVGRVVKRGGLVCIIAPASGVGFHRHPIDCWRVYPDGMKWLLRQGGLEPVRVKLKGHDCVGIARKS